MAKQPSNDTRVSRSDLEAAFGSVIGETREATESALPQLAVAVGAIALAVVALSYMAGRRRGRKKSAVIEIRQA